MRKQYDDFTQLKLKDMSKSISDMTYMYINPETDKPTLVPPAHYEKILDKVEVEYLNELRSVEMLGFVCSDIMRLKKDYGDNFYKALLCIDMGINPKDMRINEQIALSATSKYIELLQSQEKKKFRMLKDDIINAFEKYKNDPKLHSEVIKSNNEQEEDRMFSRKMDDGFER